MLTSIFWRVVAITLWIVALVLPPHSGLFFIVDVLAIYGIAYNAYKIYDEWDEL